VLLWPAEPVPGPLLVPHEGQVAAFAADGSRWAAHDGTSWGPVREVPWKSKARSRCSPAVASKGGVFLARAEGKGESMRLLAMRLAKGTWRGPETLAGGRLGSSILTASGEAVFCFYVRLAGAPAGTTHTVCFRRWRNGAWGAPQTIAAEAERINQLAAPTVSPPSYAAILWDRCVKNARESSWVRFARVPNP
jgi:hypothetical protein